MELLGLIHRYTSQFHPLKIHLTHKLNEGYFDRRLEFCENLTERITNNPRFLDNIFFSDESIFFLNGHVMVMGAGNGDVFALYPHYC